MSLERLLRARVFTLPRGVDVRKNATCVCDYVCNMCMYVCVYVCINVHET